MFQELASRRPGVFWEELLVLSASDHSVPFFDEEGALEGSEAHGELCHVQ